jgi:hypothetical protein
MATITTTDRVDDLDGSEADVTVVLTVNTKRYTVDLSKDNYAEYIAPLVKAARPSTRGRPRKQTSDSKRSKRPVQRTPSKGTAYSRLSAADQASIRGHLRRVRGRVADSEVTAWKSSGKP